MMNKKQWQMPLAMALGFILTLMIAVNSPSVSAAKGQRDLRFGSVGPDVAKLQKTLSQKGYNPGPADGIYAFKTKNAVAKWQKNKGLATTGKMDKKGIHKINEKPQTKSLRINISPQEKHILAQAVHGEARGETLEGQVAVAAVIINRTQSGIFPKTIKGVVYEPWAFTAVHDGQFYMQPDREAYRAVELAIKGWDPTKGSLYYYNPQTADSPWIWSRKVVKKIGRHVFAI